ncbi:MAG: DEAD/DEAH box helicase [Candidatus Bathyarchaeia archaeon]
MDLLRGKGIEGLSEIQSLSFPEVLSGSNVLLISPTGSGKTYAALLPVLELFLKAKSEGRTEGISILYITPLRALNRDLLRRVGELAEALEMGVSVRHGDTSKWVRRSQARSPPDMLITTPETLQAILPGRVMRRHLKGVKWVIIDEAHELAGDKRGVQLSMALERLARLAGEFQRIGLSATVGDAETIARFFIGPSRPFKIIRSSDLRGLEISIKYLSPSRDDEGLADRLGISPGAVARAREVIEIIKAHRSTIVFTNTREHAEALGAQIKILEPNLPVAVHHGSLSRELREEVEGAFLRGDLRAIICTSSMELGIDVGSVDFVVQYLSPRQASKLAQRVGRSEHRIGGVARGCILSNWVDDLLESIVLRRRAMDGEFERTRIHERALDVLAHQVVGILLDSDAMGLEECLELLRRAYPFRNLSLEDLVAVVDMLAKEGILRASDSKIRARYPRAFRYYYENLSMIPDAKRYVVYDFFRRKRIGTLDQEFVARRCEPGSEFIMHGSTWRVIRVDDGEGVVEVEGIPPSLSAIPSWEGEMIPVEHEVAKEVGRLREEVLQGDGSRLAELDGAARGEVMEFLKGHAAKFPLPTDRRAFIEQYENCIILHACLGTLANEAIGMGLAALLSSKYGFRVLHQSDPYRVVLIGPAKMSPEEVHNELMGLSPDSFSEIVDRCLEETDLLAWTLWHVAKRFGAVGRDAEYSASRAKLIAKALKGTAIEEEAKREIYTERIDVERAEEFLERVRKGEILLDFVHQTGPAPSPLAAPLLDKILPRDFLMPQVPADSLLDIVKDRILSTKVKLVCMFKGDWEGIRVVGDLPERIKCPSCGSTLIALTSPRDEVLAKAVRKRIRGSKLSPEEGAALKSAWLSASLIQASGKKAAIILSGHGIGPTTASRIIRKLFRSEAEMYAEIIKAERLYARTRAFWG